jgi:protein gp37
MSDIFHAAFSFEMIERVFDVMNAAEWHQFQVLTKRPERAARYADRLAWSPNIWLGTSVENMGVAHRVDALRSITQASVRFVSAEPLLGSLADLELSGIEWVIGGGESGAGHRPCDPTWARELRDKCVASNIAFFWKQWGGRTSKSGGRLLDDELWDQYPEPLPGLTLF